VGGYYGGKLALKYTGRSKHDVIFYARGEHLAAIRRDGLRLITVDGEYIVRPAQATDNPAEMGPLDLAIFCTKSYGLEDAARAVAGNVGADSIVLPLLNGVDITDRLRAVLPKGEVLYGGVFISSAIQGRGVVRQVGGTGQLFFGPANRADVEKYRPIETLLKDAGIKAELSADALLPLWTKYIFIGPMAGVTSLTGKPFGEVLGSPDDRVLATFATLQAGRDALEAPSPRHAVRAGMHP
jgi:2-dehydropantoate 2-reductase